MWKVDAERAREMEAKPDPLPRITVNAVVRQGRQIWRAFATSLIAGGWDTEIDARTGLLVFARRRPGR